MSVCFQAKTKEESLFRQSNFDQLTVGESHHTYLHDVNINMDIKLKVLTKEFV